MTSSARRLGLAVRPLLDSRWLLFGYYGLRGLSLLFLPFAFDLGAAWALFFIVFYGLDWVATVPPTVRLAADIFGKRAR